MTIVSGTLTDRTVEVEGKGVRLVEDGTGEAVVVLHHSTGNLGWLEFYAKLAESFRVVVPDMPGYGQSERPEWARSPRDLAILLHQLLDKIEIDRAHVIGLGLGGWIAAEMAAMNQGRLASLTLVGAAGLRPGEGEIVDQVLIGWDEYVRLGFADGSHYDEIFGTELEADVKQLWDFSREMTARITWKPWMFSLQLPHLLAEVRTPAMVVWGGQDRVVPISCGRRYVEALGDAKLEIIEDGGHVLDLERPDELAALVTRHAGDSGTHQR